MSPRRPLPISFGSLALALVPAAAHAGDGAAAPGLGELVLRAGLALAGVLALIGGLAFFVRRWRVGARPGPSRAHLVPLDRVDFGGRRELRLVRVHDRLVLVGVTGERISLLTELPAGEDEAQEPKGLQLLQKLASSP